MGRNWAQDKGLTAEDAITHELWVNQIMERRVAVWLATRLSHRKRLGVLLSVWSTPPSLFLPADEPPSTSSCDETCPPAA